MKNTTFYLSLFLLLMTIAGCTPTSRSENPENWTQAQVDDWFDSKEWLGDSRVQPDASINRRRLAIEYHDHKQRWDASFAFIRKGDFSMAPGDYPLDGDDAIARVSEYDSKNHEEVFYETHKKYADIQFLVSGEELIGRSELTSATVKDPYDEARDVELYNETEGNNLLVKPGTFYIFFAGEAHRPGMKVNENVPVKKVVIKVRD